MVHVSVRIKGVTSQLTTSSSNSKPWYLAIFRNTWRPLSNSAELIVFLKAPAQVHWSARCVAFTCQFHQQGYYVDMRDDGFGIMHTILPWQSPEYTKPFHKKKPLHQNYYLTTFYTDKVLKMVQTFSLTHYLEEGILNPCTIIRLATRRHNTAPIMLQKCSIAAKIQVSAIITITVPNPHVKIIDLKEPSNNNSIRTFIQTISIPTRNKRNIGFSLDPWYREMMIILTVLVSFSTCIWHLEEWRSDMGLQRQPLRRTPGHAPTSTDFFS